MRTNVRNAMLMTLMTWCGYFATFSTSDFYAKTAAKAGKCYVKNIQRMTCKACAEQLDGL
jgi:hypothetical protein